MILILFCCFTVESTGQIKSDKPREIRNKPPNALYLGFQPVDLGVALRSDIHPWRQVGVYGSLSYGQWNLYKASGLGKHVKGGIGILMPFGNKDESSFDLSAGFNYHWVSGEIVPSKYFTPHDIFKTPYSFELGWSIKLSKLAIAFAFDFLRMESCIYVGVPL